MNRRRRGSCVLAIALAMGVIVPAAAASARVPPVPRPTVRWLARSSWPRSFVSPVGVVATQDGASVVIAGTSSGEDGRDIVTAAYDAVTGALRWSARFDGSAHGNDVAVGIVAAPDGSTVFVVGSTIDPDTHSDYVTIAYDAATGDVRWTSRFDGAQGKDTAAAIGVAPDGSDVYVTGTTTTTKPGSSDQVWSMTTVGYVAANGVARWHASYGGPDPEVDPRELADALVVSPDGLTVFVAGEGYVPPDGWESGFSFDLVAYRAWDGQRSWDARPIGWACSYPTPRSLAISPDGTILVVTGQQDEGCNISFLGYATAAVDARSGETLWYTSPTGEYWTSTAGATGVAFTPDGTRVVQTGNLLSPHLGTVAYAPADGTEVWHTRYTADDGWNLATGVVASPDSQMIFVTGYSHGDAGGWDYVTIAYRASDGHRAWVERFDDPQHRADAAYALAISPDGKTLYVTGWAEAGDAQGDAVTIAYGIA